MGIKLLMIALSMSLVLGMGTLEAFGASAPPGIGTVVTGECGSGPIATPMDVANAATWTATTINSQILEVGKALQLSLKGLTETVQTSTKGQIEAMRELLVQTKSAEARERAQRTYGAASQSALICPGRNGAAGVQVGKRAETGLTQDLNTRAAKVGEGQMPSSRALEKWHEELLQEHAKIDGKLIFPESGVIPQVDVKDAEGMAQLSLNPFPSPKVPDGTKSSASGRDAQVRQRVKSSRLAVPQDTKNSNIAYSAPVVELGDIVKSMQAAMGSGGGQLEGLSADGKTSMNAFFNVLVNSRFASPNWYEQTATKNEVFLLRELTYMQAFQLELLRRSLEQQMRTNDMLATMIGIMVEKDGANIGALLNPASAPTGK